MTFIQHKVFKDLHNRTLFLKGEIERRELLSIRRTEILRGTSAWWSAVEKLNNMGGSGSITRIRNMCKYTGRPRGVLVKYGESRLEWRRRADRGEIPGIRRGSW